MKTSGNLTHISRTQVCNMNRNIEPFENSKKNYENPQQLRFGNLVMKNVLVLVSIIMAIGVFWKLKQQKKPMRVSGNFNVITLKQTVILLIMISLDNTGLSYVICWDNSLGMNEEVVFKLEIARVILVENILFKFLLPLYFLLDSRSKLPSLWSDGDDRKLNFFMTPPSLRARPVVFKYQTEQQQQQQQQQQPSTRTGCHHVLYVTNLGTDLRIDFPDVDI